MNMESETSCDDPQFMNMLATCLRAEIETANNALKSLRSEIKEYKSKVQMQLRTRKELKERMKNAQENRLVLADALNKQDIQFNEICQKLELARLNLDNDYKILKLQCERYENILKEYEITWQTYRAKYEEYPLAKVRKEARIKLEKLRVDGMMVARKIEEFEKILKQRDHVTWLRLREKIVEFSRASSNNAKLRQTLQDLNKSIGHRREELNAVNKELARRLKMREEEKKARALKVLEMPPPRLNFTYVHTIYGSKQKTNSFDNWKRNYENSIDTLSVDTMMLEEMCTTEESTIRRPENSRNLGNVDHDRGKRHRSTQNASIDARSPSLDQDQEEMERDEAVSEMDENVEPEAIDAPLEEELEHRAETEVDQERLEEVEFRSSVHEDKQTAERGEDRAKEVQDPPSKRMKLISEEDKARASPAASLKGSRLERKWSQLAGPSPGPKITKIETIRYVSPMKKPANPNPASMFTPGHYDYSDSSNMSFCVDNNLADLKADQISLYGGSVRDFCECSNISAPIQNPEVNPGAEANENLPSTSKSHNFPQFDFSNILKGNSKRHLF